MKLVHGKGISTSPRSFLQTVLSGDSDYMLFGVDVLLSIV